MSRDDMILDGPASLHDFLGDLVVYRNLCPVDQRLPDRHQVAKTLGLDDRIPRKTEPDYARIIARMATAAADLNGAEGTLNRLVAVGDTRLNDGTAFRNLCAVTGWPGVAIICSEKESDPPSLQEAEPGLYLANRWSLLRDFRRVLEERRFPVDERTMVMMDLDKTALGARGRNDQMIDEARVAGVRATAEELLGSDYDEEGFLSAYRELNQPPYHAFTADNQDYLVYVCLVIGAGLRHTEEVSAAVLDGSLTSFAQFIGEMEAGGPTAMSKRLRQVHGSIYQRFLQGDPTPFKEFRYHEYRATLARMGCLAGSPSASQALDQEIVITREVAELTAQWRESGATVLGISDKPDEAALPTPEAVAAGSQPLHRALTHRVGETIS